MGMDDVRRTMVIICSISFFGVGFAAAVLVILMC